MVATGFQEVHATLAQLLFLQEATRPIEGIHVQFKLDREYDASEIGHFRAFWSLYLREPKLGILGILAGKADKADRFRKDITENRDERPGIVHGIASGQWKVAWNYHPEQKNSSEATTDEEDVGKYEPIGAGSGIGIKTIKQLASSYKTGSFIRFEPVLSLMDFDECMLMPILNKSLAEKLESIRIFANGYMLLDLGKEAFQIDNTEFELELGNAFSDSELADPWVRIRPAEVASAFKLSFSDRVPVRMFKSKKATSFEA